MYFGHTDPFDAYFAVKERTKEAIDIVFGSRPLDEANIARLWEDEAAPGKDTEDQIISDILFYYFIWQKTGAIPANPLRRIKQLTAEILVSGQTFSRLNTEESADFMEIVKSLNQGGIAVFSSNAKAGHTYETKE